MTVRRVLMLGLVGLGCAFVGGGRAAASLGQHDIEELCYEAGQLFRQANELSRTAPEQAWERCRT